MENVQFKLNLSIDVKAWLEREAEKNLRSQGAQIVVCLRANMSEKPMQESNNPRPQDK